MQEKETTSYLVKYVNQVEDTLNAMMGEQLDAMKYQALALRMICSANTHTYTDKSVSMEMAKTLERQIWQITRAINNLQRNTEKMKELTSANIPWEIHQKENWVEWDICKVKKEN